MNGVAVAIEKAGTSRAFASSLNPPVTIQAVGQWRKRGWVPPARALEIERLYGIDRAYLVRPDLVALVGKPA